MPQPTEKNTTSFSLRELAELLVRHHGYTEGIYETTLEFQVAIGSVGPNPQEVLPGAIVGISRIGLTKIPEMSPHSVDASLLAKPKKPRAKK